MGKIKRSGKMKYKKIDDSLQSIQLRFGLTEKDNWAMNEARHYLKKLYEASK